MTDLALDTLPDRLVGFVEALRSHGLRVGTSESIDAASALRALGMTNRPAVHAGLAATLTHRADDRSVFDSLFDLWFPAAPGAVSAATASSRDELLERLAQALAQCDDRAMREAASAAVELFGDVSTSDAPSWSSARTLDQLNPARAIARADALSVGGAPTDNGSSGSGSGESGEGIGGSDGSDGHPVAVDSRLRRDQLRSGIDRFRGLVEAEALRRNAQTRGREQVGRFAIRATLDDRDLLGVSSADLAQLQRTLAPLTRRLAARLATRRRQRRGAIDIRRTLRSSLATGGVPLDPSYRRRVKHKVDLVILADLSGSVGGFSTFTMLLVQALQRQFRRVRIFGFISSPADLTELVRTAPPGAPLTSWARREPQLTARGGATSYGSTFADFTRLHLDSVTHRTVVLILGDARSNYGSPNAESLRLIQRRSRRTLWLNPEPARTWNTGDSLVRVYGGIVPMHECRTLAQLRRLVVRELG